MASDVKMASRWFQEVYASRRDDRFESRVSEIGTHVKPKPQTLKSSIHALL